MAMAMQITPLAIRPFAPTLRAGVLASDAPAAAPDAVALSAPAPAPPVAANPWPELERMGLLAATPATSGPIGGALTATARQGLLGALTRLETSGVTFERQRGLRFPSLMKKYVPLSAGELANALEKEPVSFKHRFNVNVNGATHVRVASLQGLQLLDAVQGLGAQASPARSGAVEAARSLESRGWKFRAYNYSDDYGDSDSPTQPGTFPALLALNRRGTVDAETPTHSNDRVRFSADSQLIALDYFDGSGTDRGLANGPLAAGVREVTAKGYRFRTDDYYRNNYMAARDAYTALQGGNTLRMGQPDHVAVMVQAADLKSLGDLEKRLQTADDVHERIAKTALAAAGLENQGDAFVHAVMQDKHPHSLYLKAAVLAELVRAEAVSGDARYALENAVEDMGHVLNEDAQPARVAAYTEQFVAALRTSGRKAAWSMLATMRDELRARTGSPAEYQRLQDVVARLMAETHSINAAMEGIDLIRIPVGTETEDERLKLFLDIAARESEKSLDRTASDYRAILVHRTPGESLTVAGGRMCRVLETLALKRQQERASEVFATIQGGVASGRYGKLTADEALQRFSEQMVLSKSVDDALAALAASTTGGVPAGPATVQQSDDAVVIGGIRIPRTGQ